MVEKFVFHFRPKIKEQLNQWVDADGSASKSEVNCNRRKVRVSAFWDTTSPYEFV